MMALAATDPTWHGPLFTRFLVDLWEHYAGVPAAMAMAMGAARLPRRVNFASYADIPTRVTAQPLGTSDATPAIAATAADGATAAQFSSCQLPASAEKSGESVRLPAGQEKSTVPWLFDAGRAVSLRRRG